MRQAEDLTGRVFGKLKVVNRCMPYKKAVYWRCFCDCGNTVAVTSQSLRRGQKSCSKCCATKPQMLTYQGETLTLSEWSKKIGISAGSLYARLRKGWDVARVLTTPPSDNQRKALRITFQGETLTLSEWSKKTRISSKTIRARLKKGWAVERVLSTPPKQ